jgi:hypothetical protein
MELVVGLCDGYLGDVFLINKTMKGDSDSNVEEVLTCIQLTSNSALSEDFLVAI